jgi:microcystin-dependent protein
MAFVGEIRMFAGNFAPAGWHLCDGALVPISENAILFTVIGTTYGGDGQATFALPNLQSRVPVHKGTGTGLTAKTIGETGGAESVTLAINQIPGHSHPLLVSTDTGAQVQPAGNVLGSGASITIFRPIVPNQAMAASVSPTGGSQPHENMQPFLVINYIISLFGVFPAPN